MIAVQVPPFARHEVMCQAHYVAKPIDLGTMHIRFAGRGL